jgi:hypothetical protein
MAMRQQWTAFPTASVSGVDKVSLSLSLSFSSQARKYMVLLTSTSPPRAWTGTSYNLPPRRSAPVPGVVSFFPRDHTIMRASCSMSMAPLAEKVYEATMQYHIPPSTVSVQINGLCTSPAGFIPSGPENVFGQIGPFMDLFFHQGGVVGVVGTRTPKRDLGHASRPFAEN